MNICRASLVREESLLVNVLLKTGIVTYPWYESLWQGIKATYNLLIALLLAFGTLIGLVCILMYPANYFEFLT